MKRDPHYEALAVFLFVIGVLSVLLGGGCQETTRATSDTLTPNEVRVVDGDTIRFTDRRTPIRLLQINAPEDRQCFGPQARRYLEKVVASSSTLQIRRDSRLDADRYQRQWVYLEADGRNVNLDMVRRGYAVPYFIRGEQGDFTDRIQTAADRAREAGRGLWAVCAEQELPPQR